MFYSISTNFYSIPLPHNARADSIQISWTQINSLDNNTGVWQLDNVVLLYANELDKPIFDTFNSQTSSSPILLYSGGSIEVRNPSINCKSQIYLIGEYV